MLPLISGKSQTPFSGFSGLFTGDSKPPDVAVIIPNGGESYGFSDPLTVEWTAVDDSFGPAPISIGISTDQGGAYTIVAAGLPNSGAAIVNPPGIVSQYAKVWVIAEDGFGLEGEDSCDDFFTFDESFSAVSGLFTGDTKPPTVTVMLPNGGEAYYYAEPLLVKWDAADDSFGATPVTISVSTDGGATYSLVATGLPDNDSAYVSAPQVITDLAMVKVFVQDEFGLTAFDESDGVFILEGIFVDLKAFLEGPFAGTGMLSYLNFFGYVPLSQPYSQPPWNYAGTESVAAMPNNDVVDWVLIEIRDANDAQSATGATAAGMQAGFIMENGSVVATDGATSLQFGVEVAQNLFAVVRHRNHLDIMSAFPLSAIGNQYSYDFTDGMNKVFGSALGHKEVVPGTWAMAGGDGKADGQVNNSDKNDVWVPQSGQSGYQAGDFDMNGDVNNQDKLDIWVPNSGRSSQVVQ